MGIGLLASVRDPVVKEDNFIVQDGGVGSRMIEIPEQELVFKTSRSSGPGGQNVNKVSTRVTVLFDVANTACLSDSQKKRILRQLSTRASKAGVIRVVSQRYRTQKANRRAAAERLQQLLRKALRIKPVRKKTRVPVWAKEQRLEEKKRRSTLKRQRTQRDFES